MNQSTPELNKYQEKLGKIDELGCLFDTKFIRT